MASPSRPNDVAYTFNQLVEVGSAVKWGADVQQFLDAAEATDENTVVCNFKVPAPRFFDFVAYKFDIGVYIMPKHIFKDQNFAEFTFFDIEKGWPVTTGPWRVVYSGPEQKVLDRADDWWGVDAGVAELPAMTRFVYLPDPGEQGLDLRHHRQPVRHRHRHPAGGLRHRLRRERQGHAPGPDRSRRSATSTGGRTRCT